MSVTIAPDSIEAAEKRAKRFWIALVVFLFVVQSTIMAVVMHLAIGDPAAAVVPDYHTAALNWDQTRQAREAPDRLGWKITFNASDIVDGRGMRAIELTVFDSTGKAIDHLAMDGILYHHARANDIISVQLKSVGAGKYLTLAPLGRRGLWQLEIAIDGAGEPMTKSVTFSVGL